MMSSSGMRSQGTGDREKLTPHLDEQVTKTLNLTVLQRTDPFINEILMTATHVTLYVLDVDATQWSRKDVEGSLFVVKRNTQPRFQFIVMNRRSEEDFVESLLQNFEFEVQLPYLLYRNAAQEVNGIWFYSSRECEEVADLFARILSAYPKVPPTSSLPSSKSEFEELEAVSTSSVIEGPLEPSYTASAALHDDTSFLNFFSSAMTIGNESSTVKNPSLLPAAHEPPRFLGIGASTPILLAPSLAVSAPSTPPMLSLHAASEPSKSSDQVVSLVNPSSFFSLPSTSTSFTPAISFFPTSPINLPLNTQRTHGSSALKSFQPPIPPAPLISGSISAPVSRERVQDALLMLAQDNQFVDMFYRALLQVHQR